MNEIRTAIQRPLHNKGKADLIKVLSSQQGKADLIKVLSSQQG